MWTVRKALAWPCGPLNPRGFMTCTFSGCAQLLRTLGPRVPLRLAEPVWFPGSPLRVSLLRKALAWPCGFRVTVWIPCSRVSSPLTILASSESLACARAAYFQTTLSAVIGHYANLTNRGFCWVAVYFAQRSSLWPGLPVLLSFPRMGGCC